ncbi:UDP-glycosyltransferase family, conserved site [Sesbania bispinosa]|nr:UDP-glycosyltransferase family, conserved site [Sesbania bispinosa]
MANKPHILVLTFPSPGHINPMLQFSKLLQHEGARVTLVTTHSYSKNLKKLPSTIGVETITDGFDNGGIAEARGFKIYLNRFWEVGPDSLGDLLENLGKSTYPADCLIYDSFMPWALDVAKKFGIVGVAYLTQNLAVNSIYYHVHIGKLQIPLTENGISLPALPQLQLEDMPSLLFNYEQNTTFLDLAMGQYSNMDKADWLLCNSFYELEKEVADWTMKIWSNFRTIGPSIPSMFLDKRIKNDEDYGVTQFTSDECLEWLNDKPKGSVVYVSFGSLAALNEEQTEEIACALRDSGSYFLWVVRASEEPKMPKDFEKKTEKGLVVTWCPQLKVLAHEAIGCFITHCGWNSTLEALSMGVPTIAMPFWSDQRTNAKLIVDVWKMGIRAPFDEKRIVRQDALKRCILEIVENEKGKEIKNNAMQWKSLAVGAAGEGGSSHKNIKEFLNSLLHLRATCTESQISA